jgi:hypothetical protein
MAPTRRQFPHRFDDALAYRDDLIPAAHCDVLLSTVQEKLIAYLQGCRAIRAEHDRGVV